VKKPLRVLLVEDSEDDALLVVRRLQKEGYNPEYERVETSETMRSALQRKMWDIILCDYKLPRFNGMEALSIYKKAALDIPFIIISGTIGEETAVEVMKAGAHDYIMKDKLSRLVPAIERELKDADIRRERRQAKQALDAAEAKYSSIVENAIEGIFQSTPEGQFLTANPALARIYGYDSTQELISGVTDIGTQLYNDPEDRMKVLQRLAEDGSVSDFTVRQRRKDGSSIWVSISARAVRNETGAVVRLEGVVVDVSDHKRIEELHQARIRLMEFAVSHSMEDVLQRTLDEIGTFTNSPIGFYHFVEADQKTLSLQAWSTRTVREFCTAPGKGLHYSIDNAGVWVDCVHQRRSVIHNDYDSLPHRKGMPEGHARVVRELVVPIFRDNRIVAILGVGNKPSDYDETDVEMVSYFADIAWEIAVRKRLEELYMILAENSLSAVFIVQDGKFRFINTSAVKYAGYSAEDLIGKSADMIVHPNDRDMVKMKGREMLHDQEMTPIEYRMVTKEGDIRWIMQIVSPIEYEGEKSILGNAIDITGLKQAEEARRQSLEKLRKTLGATVQAMAVAVETRDPYTAGHQRRVAEIARAIATEMGLSGERIDGLRMAGVIHDIGKISIPAEILSKPSQLKEIEHDLIKTHSQSGYDILKDIEFPWPIARIVLEHHERMNGSGYPNGLTGDSLLIESRILAVADVVEAIASHRPYRPALGIDTALDEIKKNRGILYDAVVVDACLLLFREKKYSFDQN
jgi:PAS domain S-box-containing protein/putative nucleotidyltransferase with HDIG domain